MSEPTTTTGQSDYDLTSGLTPEEQRVMNTLVKAWKQFLALDRGITPESQKAFQDGIHQAQQVLAEWALHRAFPEYWK